MKNDNGGINLKNNNGKINLKKIAFFALMLFVLAGCGNNGDNYYNGDYYEDSYDALVTELNYLSIYDLDDIASMVVVAWEYGAYVEVDYVDYYGYTLETDSIDNEQILEDFLDEIYNNEIDVLDVEVIEDDYDLILVFTVEAE